MQPVARGIRPRAPELQESIAWGSTVSTPENKGPTVAAVAPLGLAFEQTDSSAPASFCGNPDDDEIGLDESDDRRGFGRIKAELALRGYGLLETSGGYLILRWGWTKLAPDLSAVGAFLRQVGGLR